MDFGELQDKITELIEFVRPVAELTSNMYHAVTEELSEIGSLAEIAVMVFVVLAAVALFYQAISD